MQKHLAYIDLIAHVAVATDGTAYDMLYTTDEDGMRADDASVLGGVEISTVFPLKELPASLLPVDTYLFVI